MLKTQPFRNLGWQAIPVFRCGQHVADPGCQIGRERKLATIICRDRGIIVLCLCDNSFCLDKPFKPQHLTGKEKRVAGHQLLDEIFLDLPQHPPHATERGTVGRPPANEAHRQHGCFDNRSHVHPVLLRQPGMSKPQLFCTLPRRDRTKPAIAIIGLERVTAVRHKIHHLIKLRPSQMRIWRGADHLIVQAARVKRSAAGHAKDVLRQNVQASLLFRHTIMLTHKGGVTRGLAFQHFKPVGWHKQCTAWIIQPMVCTANTLKKAARTFWRSQINDQIHVSPVDPQIKRGRTHDGTQRTCNHRRFYLAALLGRQGAVMKGNCQSFFIRAPQFLKDKLSLTACVDKNKDRPVVLNNVVNRLDGMTGGMTRPGDPFIRHQDGDIRFCPRRSHHQLCTFSCLAFLWHKIPAQLVGICHRCRQADTPMTRAQTGQPRQVKREQVAPLCIHHRMQLIQNDAFQPSKQAGGIRIREKQCQLLRRCHQNVWWGVSLSKTFTLRRIACPGFEGNRQSHFSNGDLQIALHVHRQGFQRRNIERVQRLPCRTRSDRRTGLQLDQGCQETSQCFPATCRGDQKRRLLCEPCPCESQLMWSGGPATPFKPAFKDRWQDPGCFCLFVDNRFHHKTIPGLSCFGWRNQ